MQNEDSGGIALLPGVTTLPMMPLRVYLSRMSYNSQPVPSFSPTITAFFL